MNITKKCIKCGEEKLLTNEFFAYRSDTEKYRNICRICKQSQVHEHEKEIKIIDPFLAEERTKKQKNYCRKGRAKKKLTKTKHYVYCIQNIINLKVYIGYTIDPKERWINEHNSALNEKSR